MAFSHPEPNFGENHHGCGDGKVAWFIIDKFTEIEKRLEKVETENEVLRKEIEKTKREKIQEIK